jgi:hypothetical protein
MPSWLSQLPRTRCLRMLRSIKPEIPSWVPSFQPPPRGAAAVHSTHSCSPHSCSPQSPSPRFIGKENAETGDNRSRARMSRCLRKQLSVQFGASPATLKYSSNLDIYCRYHSFTTGMKHKIYLRLLNLSFRVSSIAWHKFSAVRVMNSPVPKSSTCYRDPKCIAVRYTTHIPLVTEATMFR